MALASFKQKMKWKSFCTLNQYFHSLGSGIAASICDDTLVSAAILMLNTGNVEDIIVDPWVGWQGSTNTLPGNTAPQVTYSYIQYYKFYSMTWASIGSLWHKCFFFKEYSIQYNYLLQIQLGYRLYDIKISKQLEFWHLVAFKKNNKLITMKTIPKFDLANSNWFQYLPSA